MILMMLFLMVPIYTSANENEIENANVEDTDAQLVYNTFTKEIVNKPEVLELVARKASAKLGRAVRVSASDGTKDNTKTEQMETLLQFGRMHTDIINIKND